jgi:hypothetical protein
VRFRRALTVLSAAALLATFAAALVHGAFEPMMVVVWIGLISAFVLFVLGSIVQPRPRTSRLGAFLVRCSIVVLIATPMSFVAARGVVEFELWRAKQYFASALQPRLEKSRSATGRYPLELRLREHPPADAPWLMRRFRYASDGRTYRLWVMDPGVCGRVVSYSSAMGRWGEAWQPCWY